MPVSYATTITTLPAPAELLRMERDTDYDNAIEAAALATLLFAVANAQGLFMGASRQRRDLAATLRAAREWEANVGVRLRHIPAGDALYLLSAYDIIFRMLHGSPAPAALTDGVKLRAFRALIGGDRSVDRYLLLRSVRTEIKRRNREFLGTPLRWYADNLMRFRKTLAGQTRTTGKERAEAIQMTELLLGDVMTAGRAEPWLADLARTFFQKIDALDYGSLTALNLLLPHAAGLFSPDRDRDADIRAAMHRRLHRVLAAHPAAPRAYRLALRLQHPE